MPLFQSFKKIFSSSNFFNLGDEIVSYFLNIKKLETGICILNFEQLPNKVVEVKCDLIDRRNGEVFITRSFAKTDVLVKDLPEYIAKSLNNEKKSSTIKLQADDIEALFSLSNYEKLDNCRWFKLLDNLKENDVAQFELHDYVFYTLVKCMDSEGKITSLIRIGVINEIPQKIYDAVYPFKSKKLSVEDC